VRRSRTFRDWGVTVRLLKRSFVFPNVLKGPPQGECRVIGVEVTRISGPHDSLAFVQSDSTQSRGDRRDSVDRVLPETTHTIGPVELGSELIGSAAETADGMSVGFTHFGAAPAASFLRLFRTRRLTASWR
jgi:hypothetical protein